jgi:mycothiol synthase
MHIRPFFATDDYPDLVEVYNAAYPGDPLTERDLHHRDCGRDPWCRFRRWVVEWDGRLVAFAEYDQHPQEYHAQKFVIDSAVHPGHQRQGVGTMLYELLLEALEPFHPIVLRKRLRADLAGGIRFLEARGFRVDRTIWPARLEVTTFDFAPYAALVERVAAQAISLRSLKDLEADTERDQKLYQLLNELYEDVPSSEPRTPLSHTYFCDHRQADPRLLPAGCFVAVHRGEYVGITELKATNAEGELTTGLTAVKRLYRKGGLALALKVQSIAYAKARGCSAIWTSNDALNAPILALNERLGFVRRRPPWLELVRKEDAATDR